ncbi:MAG: hypothetical protein NWF00_03390 [Candidatus Bathyarchaeota archaeon]|nr:hypothetical protein [Candidatus Bathyarchaeota archaeon]
MTIDRNKISGEHLTELKELVREQQGKASKEKILAIFCQRHGVSVEQCQKYYDQLVADGEIKE